VIRWILCEGREQDKEVEAPGTQDEIVILKYEQWPGRAQYLPLPLGDDHDGIDDTVITFARAGNDDLLGEKFTSTGAIHLYHFLEGEDAKPWAELTRGEMLTYRRMTNVVLAAVTEYMKEERKARGQS